MKSFIPAKWDKAFQFLKEKINDHDKSKFSDNEFEGYRAHYYKSDEDSKDSNTEEAYNKAHQEPRFSISMFTSEIRLFNLDFWIQKNKAYEFSNDQLETYKQKQEKYQD